MSSGESSSGSSGSASTSTSTTMDASPSMPGSEIGNIGPKGPMIGADGVDYSVEGQGMKITPQPTSDESAANLALSGADVSNTVKQGIQHALKNKVGGLSHEDLLGARARALREEMSQQSAKIMDEAARVGVAAPPLLQVSDLASWRAEREAAAAASQQDMNQSAKAGHRGPYPDPYAMPTPRMP